MKQLFSFLLLLIVTGINAQAPQSIPYQAVVRNTDGTVMADAAMTITFKIHDASATGNVVYEENHAATTNSQGLISLNVGNGSAVAGTFSEINWGAGNKFLHVLMNAGNGVVDLGTQQMMSVPYALYTEDVNVRVSVTGDSLFIGDQVSIVPGVSAANSLYQLGNGVIDIDGNFYPSIIINGQEWMQENLNVSKYRNGDPINTGLGNYAWSVTNSGAYTSANFGKLYNHWAVVDQRGVCPTGWHVPSTSEWSLLVNFIDPVSNGGYYSSFFDETYSNAAGGRMKSVSFWGMPNIGASNESGFSAFPTGFRTEDDSFVTSNCVAGWWTSDPLSFYPDSFEVSCDISDVTRRGGTYNRQTGMSIRCIKD